MTNGCLGSSVTHNESSGSSEMPDCEALTKVKAAHSSVHDLGLASIKYFVLDLGSYASASRKREGYTLK